MKIGDKIKWKYGGENSVATIIKVGDSVAYIVYDFMKKGGFIMADKKDLEIVKDENR